MIFPLSERESGRDSLFETFEQIVVVGSKVVPFEILLVVHLL